MGTDRAFSQRNIATNVATEDAFLAIFAAIFIFTIAITAITSPMSVADLFFIHTCGVRVHTAAGRAGVAVQTVTFAAPTHAAGKSPTNLPFVGRAFTNDAFTQRPLEIFLTDTLSTITDAMTIAFFIVSSLTTQLLNAAIVIGRALASLTSPAWMAVADATL